MSIQNIDVLWDDNPVDITSEANFIWSIANKLRGVYMPDKYGDVIIPMTIIRRLECALEPTKKAVVAQFEKNPAYPEKAMYRLSGFQFYNTSNFTLKELCNDADHIEENFKAYIAGFSSNVQSLLNDEDTLNIGSHIKTMSKGGCLYTVVKAFSELDLSPETYDSIKMGYIFENLIGRFFQNVDAGQYYTGRDIMQETEVLSSRIDIALSQIQPHFLYNSLTSIYRLCDVKSDSAKEAISNFSKYLRGNLDSIKNAKMITFADELEHIKAYLALEKMRYDDYLEIVYDTPLSGFFVPPLTVQPLVENAVNHGISDLPEGGCITISTCETEKHYIIKVCDNGVGFDPQALPKDSRSHIGIQSVRSRLEIMCCGTLQIGNT